MKKVLLMTTLITFSFLVTSCYSMPSDEDFCVIPATNNPTVTKQKDSNLVPSTKY